MILGLPTPGSIVQRELVHISGGWSVKIQFCTLPISRTGVLRDAL